MQGESMMKEGLIGGSLKVLTEDELARIHEASIKLLQEHGMQSDSDRILEIFKEAGADVDLETRVIRLEKEMVESALKTAPKSFILHGRDPEMDLLLESGRVYYGMGGTPEPFIWDYDLRGPRDPTLEDMVNNTRVGHASENIDFVMSLCSAGDKPKEQTYLYEYDVLFRNTTKPVIYTSPGKWYTEKFLEMASAASGGESEFIQRPCVVYFTQPISPMKISTYNEGIEEAIAMGVPVMFSPGPMTGATSPTTLAGTLVQVNAEALLGIVLAQIIKEGTPVIYAPHTGVMDMVTAQCTYGSPEQSLARAAVAQMAIHYQLPTFGMGGGAEAKLPDMEAASQAAIGMLLNALSGFTLTQTLGTLASGLYGSPEMVLICDEIVHMIKCVMGGITVTDETLALDVIKEVGHGGQFLDHDHTARHFRKELFFPILFKRQSVTEWRELGGRNILEVAHDHVQHIIATAEPVGLPQGADEALERVFHQATEELEGM
jgi:trimethylamine--corrinoid protein Co-methyltransferase